MQRPPYRLEIYRADLPRLVDKYIGETARRLRVFFTRAESLDAMLILDEGDDLFGCGGRVFHRTTTEAATSILSGGFVDSTGSYLLAGTTLTGVFVSDVRLDANEGALGEALLLITLPAGTDLTDWELVEEGKGYREWCVPAEVLNRGDVRVVSQDEEDIDSLGNC